MKNNAGGTGMFDEWSPLFTFVATVVVGLFGAGGIVAWGRLRHDKKIDVAQQEVSEDDALAARWQNIIEAQTKNLLEPLQIRLKEVESKVAALESELAASRRKYWSAISYIRTLLTWIARHIDNIDDTEVPTPPAIVNEDI